MYWMSVDTEEPERQLCVSEVCVIRFDSLEIKGLIPSCGAGFPYITKVTAP